MKRGDLLLLGPLILAPTAHQQQGLIVILFAKFERKAAQVLKDRGQRLVCHFPEGGFEGLQAKFISISVENFHEAIR